MLTRIHDRSGPHLLHPISPPFCVLILMDRAITVVIRFMFRLNITIVYAILQLESQKHVLHHLLLRVSCLRRKSRYFTKYGGVAHLINRTDVPSLYYLVGMRSMVGEICASHRRTVWRRYVGWRQLLLFVIVWLL